MVLASFRSDVTPWPHTGALRRARRDGLRRSTDKEVLASCVHCRPHDPFHARKAYLSKGFGQGSGGVAATIALFLWPCCCSAVLFSCIPAHLHGSVAKVRALSASLRGLVMAQQLSQSSVPSSLLAHPESLILNSCPFLPGQFFLHIAVATWVLPLHPCSCCLLEQTAGAWGCLISSGSWALAISPHFFSPLSASPLCGH